MRKEEKDEGKQHVLFGWPTGVRIDATGVRPRFEWAPQAAHLSAALKRQIERSADSVWGPQATVQNALGTNLRGSLFLFALIEIPRGILDLSKVAANWPNYGRVYVSWNTNSNQIITMMIWSKQVLSFLVPAALY